jgi:hypothetical protein
MSHIFSTETRTSTRPRQDATIRIQFLGPNDTKWGGQWRTVELYEFHPDFDNRLKFRGYAYTSIPDDLIQDGRYHTGVYTIMGQGYLEKPYLNVRETSIHEDDLHELMEYCRAETELHKRYTPIIIHPCPLPFPMFAKGDRVMVIGNAARDSEETRHIASRIGQTGTIARGSSLGGMSSVHFDNNEYNRGTDGRIYSSIGMPSASLRTLEPGEQAESEEI